MNVRIERLGIAWLACLGACSPSAASGGPDGSDTSDASPTPDARADGSSSLDAGATETGLPVWPTEWTADIRWSDVAPDGTRTNTWTGRVSYSWTQRAMRTDVVPPADGGVPGPPIGVAGSMLMKEGLIYFVPASGPCTLSAAFGAPRPDWLSASGGVPAATGPAAGQERVVVDLNLLDGGLNGCFNYVFDRGTRVPILFGGSSSCNIWPQGSYIEYANFVIEPVSSTVFEVPAQCRFDAAAPGGATGCTSCHAAP